MKLLALGRNEPVSSRGHECPSSSTSVSVRCIKGDDASVHCGSGLPLQAVCDQPVHSIAATAPVMENYLVWGHVAPGDGHFLCVPPARVHRPRLFLNRQ